MLEKAIEEISEADLIDLVQNQVGERRTLEFKRYLPEIGADPAKEFLADVSSFANDQGGDILFGIEEENGIASGLPGVQLDNVDATKMRNKQLKPKASADRVLKDIRRKTRRQFSAEEKIRIVLEGPHASWLCTSPMRGVTLCPRQASTVCLRPMIYSPVQPIP